MNFDLIYAEYLLQIDEAKILDETRETFVSQVRDVDSASTTPGRYYSSVFHALVAKAKNMLDTSEWDMEKAQEFVLQECRRNGIEDYFGGEEALTIILDLKLGREIPDEEVLGYAKSVYTHIQDTEFADPILKSDTLRKLLQMLISRGKIAEDKEFSRKLMEEIRENMGEVK